jgi:hypothetical protein
MRHARERRVDGVICGHIHAAVIREIEGLLYINCGDWVDSCTGIVEHPDGEMELVHWGARDAALEPPPRLQSPAQSNTRRAKVPVHESNA